MDNDSIRHELMLLERAKDVRVLYACESGSRAWGFDSPDSDYDVRFVYARPLSGYLSLAEPRDVIEESLPGDLDVVGWDLRKFLRLMRKSNPSVMEWVRSPIVYFEDSRFWGARRLADRCFDPVSSAWHYYVMARRHDARHLGGSVVPVKKYLYVVRSVLASLWCIRRFDQPPLPIDELAGAMLPASLAPSVNSMLEMKRSPCESGAVGHDEGLDEWIFDSLERLGEEIGSYRHHAVPEWSEFDDVFANLLGV